MLPTIHIKTFQGAEVTPYTQEMIALCTMIYREYPHLYDDDSVYPSYVESFVNNPHALICIAFDGENAVGLAVGMPANETSKLFKQPLLKNAYDLSTIFYLEVFGLNAKYLGQGIEEAMFEKIAHFASKNFKTIALSEFDDSSDISRRPKGYIPRENFWKQLGFIAHPAIKFRLAWKNINENERTAHFAVYWLKSL